MPLISRNPQVNMINITLHAFDNFCKVLRSYAQCKQMTSCDGCDVLIIGLINPTVMEGVFPAARQAGW